MTRPRHHDTPLARYIYGRWGRDLRELAERAGIAPQTLHNAMQGRTMSVRTVAGLARALGVGAGTIIKHTQPEEQPP